MPITKEQWDHYKSLGREGELIEDATRARWDDERVPASAINPPGAASDPDRDADDACFLFDGGGTEILFFQLQLPHAWQEGTLLSPHVHWTKTTSAAGTVLWRMNYQWAALGNVFGAWSDDSDATLIISDGDTANQHALSAFADISGSGVGLSSMLKIKLSRVGGSDTYAADAKLLEFDVHIQKDTTGSRAEYAK